MVDVEIEYEINDEYNRHAAKMTEAIMSRFGKSVSYLKIMPSHEGKFDISIDGEITYTLMMENRLPTVDEICNQIHERLRSMGRI